MNSSELRSTLALAGIFGLRMLGLFLLLPVFSLHARDLPGGENAQGNMKKGLNNIKNTQSQTYS